MSRSDSVFDKLIIVRGAGDLATATIIRLHKSGFKVICLDIDKPTVIRRTVSFAQAMFDGQTSVEGVKARRCEADEVLSVLDQGMIPVVADPEGKCITRYKPEIVIDAIIAKRNLGTYMGMAPCTIALGPGFTAGSDVDCVIETTRGHALGRLIYEGSAKPNTGIPGNIGGYTTERVIHSPCAGEFSACRKIGDIVKAGDLIAHVGDCEVRATIDGMIRGLLHDGLTVPEHFKIADIDPRGEKAEYLTCSDKARSLSGSVLEAVMHHLSMKHSD
ncbi:MAG: EF2563 family selenium-dependent molybdenum hydroxylase system protein [Spirochaetales bacterium]|nr:EF2563 family selenium-dependent molybdenum hydroxylase system protein [Spirochaetales bacterium]